MWRRMEDAPKDGRLVMLLIGPGEEGRLEDSVGDTVSIGSYQDGVGSGEEEGGWLVVGWNWCHDEYTTVVAEPVGWMEITGDRRRP